ncbi:RNA polymerase sigma factor [Isoptericola sp. NPDC057191]|uniref:RNA polymerase sigma factor n=1 Tax=Isoptericola sp. NPDC057191 TaxID=3346041 RepID=UPI00362F534D
MPALEPPAAPPSPPVTDGHEARFTALFEATHRPLLAYAVRRVADPADAADVVAEAFLIAWRRIEEVPVGPDARPWMFGVARRVLANLHRGERRRLALADRLRAEVAETFPGPDAPGSDVERALGRLGEQDQELLRLVAWEQLARDEIALVLGITRASVRVRLHRARRRLADQLAALATADDGPPAPVPALATVAPAPPAAAVRGQQHGNGQRERWGAARPEIEEAS